MKLIPCANLNHDEEAFPHLILRKADDSNVTFWHRPNAHELEEKDVQFCKKNGRRLNSITDCYSVLTHCHCDK